MYVYIWELPDSRRFHWDQERLAKVLAQARHEQGQLLGAWKRLAYRCLDGTALRGPPLLTAHRG